MANQKKKITVYDIVLIGLMAALCFVGTYLHIDIPTPLGKTMIHFGNVFCLLAGMLLGGVRGGLAAGIGSMFYDILDPAYISECWITFINKFMMAFLCGIIVSYGVKKITELHEKTASGQLQQKTAVWAKVLLGIGCVLMAGIAVLIGKQGIDKISAMVSGEETDIVGGVIMAVGTLVLVLLLITGLVFGIRKITAKQDALSVDASVAKIIFATRLGGGITGAVGYVVLYLTKNFIMGLLQGEEMATIYTTLLTKGTVSLINGIIAVIISMLLAPYFVMALQRSGLDSKIPAGRMK